MLLKPDGIAAKLFKNFTMIFVSAEKVLEIFPTPQLNSSKASKKITTLTMTSGASRLSLLTSSNRVTRSPTSMTPITSGVSLPVTITAMAMAGGSRSSSETTTHACNHLASWKLSISGLKTICSQLATLKPSL